MKGSDLVKHVRVLIRDQLEPYLWEGPDILTLLNAAEREFCARTHILKRYDLTLDTEVGVPQYDLKAVSPKIIKVEACKVAGAARPMVQTLGAAHQFLHNTTPGEPTAYDTGLNHRTLAVYRLPDAAYSIELTCSVQPQEDLALTTEPAIPEEYHLLLCEYAAFHALTDADVDGADPVLADKHEKRWYEGVRDANRQVYQFRTPPRVAMRNWTGA